MLSFESNFTSCSFGNDSHNNLSTTINIHPEPPLREKLLRWLDIPPASSIHAFYSQDRFQNSSAPFIDSRSYRTWERRPGLLITIDGASRIDRSALAAATIQRLKLKEHACLYFYFDEKYRSVISPRMCLLELIRQTILLDAGLEEVFESLYDSYGQGKYWPTVDEILDCLIAALKQLKEVYIVLDAVHKCSEPEQIEHIVHEFRTKCTTDMHLMLTGPDLRATWLRRQASTPSVSAEETHSSREDDDFRRYIKGELRRHGVPTDSSLYNTIEATCMKQARGS
jgi:hypothetical protein